MGYNQIRRKSLRSTSMASRRRSLNSAQTPTQAPTPTSRPPTAQSMIYSKSWPTCFRERVRDNCAGFEGLVILVLMRLESYIRRGGLRMITREELVAEIQRVPDKHLGELYRIIKSYEENGGDSNDDENVMAKLRDIKIVASPDFSINAKLHDLDRKDAR